MVFIYALDNKLELPISDEKALPEDFLDDNDPNDVLLGDSVNHSSSGEINIPTDLKTYMEKAKEYYEVISQKNNVSWINGKYFKKTLKQKLKRTVIPYCK